MKGFRAVMSETLVVTEAESFVYDRESCDDGDVNGFVSHQNVSMNVSVPAEMEEESDL